VRCTAQRRAWLTRTPYPKGTGQTRSTIPVKPALNASAITFAERMPQGSPTEMGIAAYPILGQTPALLMRNGL